MIRGSLSGYALYDQLQGMHTALAQGCIDIGASSMVYGLTFQRYGGNASQVHLPTTILDLCTMTDGYIGAGTQDVPSTRIGRTGALFSAISGASRASVVNCQVYGFDQVFTSYGARRIRMLNTTGHNRRVAYWGNINDTPRLQSCSNKNNLGEGFNFDQLPVISVADNGSGLIRLKFTLNAIGSTVMPGKGLPTGLVAKNLGGGSQQFFCWISVFPGQNTDGSPIAQNAPMAPGRWLAGWILRVEPTTTSTGTATVDLVASHAVDASGVYLYNGDGAPTQGPAPSFASFGGNTGMASKATVRIIAGTGTMGESFYMADVDTVSVLDCTTFGADIAFRTGSNRYAGGTGGNNVSMISCSCDATGTYGEVGTVGHLFDGTTNGAEMLAGKVGAFRTGFIHRSTNGNGGRSNNLVAAVIDSDLFGAALNVAAGTLNVLGGTLSGPVIVSDAIAALTFTNVQPQPSTPPPAFSFASQSGHGYANTLVTGTRPWPGAPPYESFVPVVANQWYSVPAATAAGAAGVVGQLTAIPIKLFQPRARLLAIACGVTLASSGGGLVRLGIYADNGGQPGALIVDAGTVATDATGTPTITLPGSVNITLIGAAYWLAAQLQAQGTGSLPHFTCLGGGGEISADLGAATAANALGQFPSTGVFASGYTTIGGLPATFPGTITLLTTVVAPLIALQLTPLS